MNKKYEFTDESKPYPGKGIRVYRIRAVRDFGIVRAGDLGGWIEKESNLSHDGNCFVYDDAIVCGNAVVSDDAIVCDSARVLDKARVRDNAKISCHAIIRESAQVFNDAKVCDHATITGEASVFGNAHVCCGACISGTTLVFDNARVYGDYIIMGGGHICGKLNLFNGHQAFKLEEGKELERFWLYTGGCMESRFR